MRTAGNSSAAYERVQDCSQAGLGSWTSVRVAASRSVFVVLTVFHAWLFWAHATTGRLTDPSTAVRWAAAALILGGFLTLRRHGRSLTSGRHALVLWLL